MWTQFVLTESSISSRDIAVIPGLLPTFLHGYEIKSGSGLGTRLSLCNKKCNKLLLRLRSEIDRIPDVFVGYFDKV